MAAAPARPLGTGRTLWLASAGFWLLVAALSTAQAVWLAQMPGQRSELRNAVVWSLAFFLPWIPITVAVWRVTHGWLPERFGGWPRLLAAHAPVAVATAITHTFAAEVAAFALADQPMAFWDRFVTQLRGQSTGEILIYTAVAATGAAMTLYERYQDRRTAAVRLEAELATARLQVLRAHLQPHFLFNSLHSIAALARAGDTAGVVRLIAALSDVLRHVLEVGDGRSTMREELEIVERYLEIQRARFADRLSVHVAVAPEALDARVPLFVVQPLVENAVRHGLSPRVSPGSLFVRVGRGNGQVRIDVEDDGVGLPAGWSLQQSKGTGLRNLASRLHAEFDGDATIEIGARERGGVRATVTLPYSPS